MPVSLAALGPRLTVYLHLGLLVEKGSETTFQVDELLLKIRSQLVMVKGQK